MKNYKALFSGLTAVVALIPGFVIIQTNLGVPPGESSKLYGGVIEAVCCCIIGLLQINKDSFTKIEITRLNRLIITYATLFFLSFLLYAVSSYYCIVLPSGGGIGHDPAFFPFIAKGQLADLITQYKSRENLLSKAGSVQINGIISTSCSFYMLLTKIMFIILYVGLFAFLTLTFGFLSTRSGKENPVT